MARAYLIPVLFALAELFTLGCTGHNSVPSAQVLLTPTAPEMNRRAPELFHVRLDTSKGTILLELHRDWSPHGVDRFYNLVRAGFYNEARFFRVIKGRWAQFGINGEPRVARVWGTQTIPDDPRKESNVRGTIAYAFAVPNGRTTQLFINLRDNSATHDAEPFVPFARVIEGMDVADALNAEYGESAGGGIRAGKQALLFEQGNQYLQANFPRLDYIQYAVVVEDGTNTKPQQTLEFAARERRDRKDFAGIAAFCVLRVFLRLFWPPSGATNRLRGVSWLTLPTGRKRFWTILATFLCCSPHFLCGAETELGRIESGSFRISFDEHGITALANPKDPFGAQMLAPNQRLGVIVRFRTGDTNWLEIPSNQMQLAGTNGNSELSFTNDIVDGPLSLTEAFKADGNYLDWVLELETSTNIAVEVGDLAIQLPVAGPRGEQPKDIFEHGFLRHQFISGDGSFLYFVRASGIPPFLLVTMQPGTHLEYFTGGAGRGGGPVFIHSGLSGGKETRGTWRQEHTFLKLGARAVNGKVRYGFRFQWANSYDEMRELLYREGLFDIRSVPGMVVPTDLTARFALHTQAHIDSIQAEFPDETKVKDLGESQPGYHLYEVTFRRLGENLLTIQHDGGRKTYLEYFATEPLETLIKKRSSFIISRQQIRDPSKWWDGVFGPYDMKHKVLRTIDDPDIFTGRMIYVLTCDDPGLCKAPFVAEKNVSFPDRKEIEGLEYYLEHFVWGHLQRTDKEQPYPYGVYGTPNWYTDRNPERRKAAAGSNSTAVRDLSKEHVWRSYDYPHVVMLYFHMYEIAKKYPQLSKYLDAAGYLERAYQTAHAFFIYPYEIYPSYYETYKWGLYNELVVLKLADALDQEGFPDRAAWLRSEWEKKVKYFVYDDPYPFRSEYAFDRTAFESSYAFAKYGATHDMKPDTNLWYDVKLKRSYSHPMVKRQDSRAFMERQLAAGLCVRGWLEASYYQLGADGGLSYMAAMGGWGILDYALNFAAKPHDWLQLGYASYLSSWCLVNAGSPENNYGFWFPGKENDGAAGWQFMSAKYGHAWMGADVLRGPWPYDGEIDLGFGGALRMAATIVTRDPIFRWVAYGGALSVTNEVLSVIPRDGLRQRLDAILGDSQNAGTNIQRLKIALDRDGFAAEKPMRLAESLQNISFTLENRTSDRHTTVLWFAPPTGTSYRVMQDGKPVTLKPTADWDYPLRADLVINTNGADLQLSKTATDSK